jgi:molybdopterin converting factor small subunit
MKVTIRFFAGPREVLGIGELTQELSTGATVQTLSDALLGAHPELGTFRLKYAVNSKYASLDVELHDGDEVACIPPVGGG